MKLYNDQRWPEDIVKREDRLEMRRVKCHRTYQRELLEENNEQAIISMGERAWKI